MMGFDGFVDAGECYISKQYLIDTGLSPFIMR
jgi:hypothetical protein